MVARGEVAWLELEQEGRRPVVVLTRDEALPRLRNDRVAILFEDPGDCKTGLAGTRGESPAGRKSPETMEVGGTLSVRPDQRDESVVAKALARREGGRRIKAIVRLADPDIRRPAVIVSSRCVHVVYGASLGILASRSRRSAS